MFDYIVRKGDDWQEIIDANDGREISSGYHIDVIDLLEALGYSVRYEEIREGEEE